MRKSQIFVFVHLRKEIIKTVLCDMAIDEDAKFVDPNGDMRENIKVGNLCVQLLFGFAIDHMGMMCIDCGHKRLWLGWC